MIRSFTVMNAKTLLLGVGVVCFLIHDSEQASTKEKTTPPPKGTGTFYRDKKGKLVEVLVGQEIPDEDGLLPPPAPKKQQGRGFGSSIQRSKSGKIANEKDVDEILGNIKEVPSGSHSHGALAIIKKDTSFAILTGPEADAKGQKLNLPLVGGAIHEKGRLIVYADDKLSFTFPAKSLLLANTIKWVINGGTKVAVVFAWGYAELKSFLEKERYQVTRIQMTDITSGSKLSDYNLVIVPFLYDLTAEAVDPLSEYVKKGGGLLGTCTSWYRTDLNVHPSNKLIGPMGIYLLPVRTEPASDGIFDASKELLRDTNSHLVAEDVLKILKDKEINKDTEMRLEQFGSILRYTFATVAVSHLPWLQEMKTQVLSLPPLNPTDKSPEKATPKVLLQVDLETIVYGELDPVEVKAHPAHKHFPGEVKDSAVRMPSYNRTIALDMRHVFEYEKEKGFESDGAKDRDADANPETKLSCTSWCSSTVYAPAGSVIEVILHSENITSFHVLIGCHTDDLRRIKENFVRYPVISWSKKFTGNTAKAASPFGGLVYVKDVIGAPSLDSVVLEVKGAVATNSFIYKETSESDWNAGLRSNNDAPWSEMVSERMIISVATQNASTITAPDALMEHWTKVVDAMSDLAGFRPELNFHRITSDIDTTGGHMHSGNPIVGYIQHEMNGLDLKVLFQFNGWVFLHELGHNHQKPEIRMDGMSEVTNLIFATFVGNTVLNKSMIESHHVNDYWKMVGKLERYLRIPQGSRFPEFQRGEMQGIAQVFFFQLETAYGWEPFKTWFRSYRNLTAEEMPNTDEEKWNTFLILFSKAVGKNLGPLFNSWGIVTSEDAKNKVSALNLAIAEERAESFVAQLTTSAKEEDGGSSKDKASQNASGGGGIKKDVDPRVKAQCLRDIDYCKSKIIRRYSKSTKTMYKSTMYEIVFGNQ